MIVEKTPLFLKNDTAYIKGIDTIVDTNKGKSGKIKKENNNPNENGSFAPITNGITMKTDVAKLLISSIKYTNESFTAKIVCGLIGYAKSISVSFEKYIVLSTVAMPNNKVIIWDMPKMQVKKPTVASICCDKAPT